MWQWSWKYASACAASCLPKGCLCLGKRTLEIWYYPVHSWDSSILPRKTSVRDSSIPQLRVLWCHSGDILSVVVLRRSFFWEETLLSCREAHYTQNIREEVKQQVVHRGGDADHPAGNSLSSGNKQLRGFRNSWKLTKALEPSPPQGF